MKQMVEGKAEKSTCSHLVDVLDAITICCILSGIKAARKKTNVVIQLQHSLVIRAWYLTVQTNTDRVQHATGISSTHPSVQSRSTPSYANSCAAACQTQPDGVSND